MNLKNWKTILPGLIIFLVAGLYWQFNQKSIQKENPQPNMVFIIGDDISWNDFGCYGNEVVQTPNIDRLADNGMLFMNAYLTISSCSPSRTSIVSGRYPHNTGSAELHTPLPESIPIFPEELQKAGYYTALAGKFHMGDAVQRGFNRLVLSREENGDGGEEAWVSCIQDRPKDQPFFMWFAAIDAHRAWGPNQFSGTHKQQDVKVPPYLVDSVNTRSDLAQYYDEIFRMDYYIGEVVKELQKQGVYDNTIIVVMADNGRPFPRCKTRVYDSGMKTPFVVSWPSGINKKGSVTESLISVIDLAPTLLELAGVEPKPTFQGKSFAGVLKNPKKEFRNYAFSEHNWHDYEALERMMVTDQYLYVLNERPKLANQGPADSNRGLSFLDLLDKKEKGELTHAQTDVFVVPRPVEELYDKKADPYQLNNLASRPEYQEKLKELRKVMREWRDVTGDNSPSELTPDTFDRTTGEKIREETERGEMPGEATNAIENNNKGPF